MRAKLLRRNARSAFTLVEVAVTATLLAALLGAAAMVTSAGFGAQRTTALRAGLENEARRALHRIALELSTADLGSIDPDPAGPFGTHQLQFRQVVDVVDGAAVWGPPCRVELDPASGSLRFVRAAGQANERRVVLSRRVADQLEGETADLTDENANGLIDERGFSVQRNGDLLTLRLTLEAAELNEVAVQRTLETSIRVRNGS
ncbi:MAG: hypothetical protein GC161_01560 [Planctomycetaceae bacterium]|nr:hypothetical protein [Planctomycetaceae bacterium]